MTFGYSSGATFIPNCITSGRILAADAPPNSRADSKDGRTRYEANSGGKDDAVSFRFLAKSQS